VFQPEKLVAPVDGAAQGLLPFGGVPMTAPKDRLVPAKALKHCVGGKQRRACGGQLDREGKPIQAPADLDGGVELRIHRPVDRAGVRGPLEQQRHGRRGGIGGRPGEQRWDGMHPFAAETEGTAARGEDAYIGRRADPPTHPADGRRQVLEVVEDEQRVALGKVLGDRGVHIAARRFADAQDGSDGGRHQAWVGERGQVDPEASITVNADTLGRDLQA
jgi:hypothetical protein